MAVERPSCPVGATPGKGPMLRDPATTRQAAAGQVLGLPLASSLHHPDPLWYLV